MKKFRIWLTKEEADYLLEWCDSVIQAEGDAIYNDPDEAQKYRARRKFWRRFKKDVRAGRKGVR